MTDPVVLTIDCGTQSLRAALVDKKGNFLGFERVQFEPYISLHPGWAEQEPSLYWKSLCEASLSLKKNFSSYWSRISGVVIDTLRDSFINLNKNGDPLRNCILWLDQRKAKCEIPIPLKFKTMFKIVGMDKTIEIIRKNTKANWIRENEPQIWEKTFKFLLVSGYLNFKLTGNFIDSRANQVGHVPFNYKKQIWEETLGHWRWLVFGVEREKLPDLIDTGEVLGTISRRAGQETGIEAGISVYAGGSDKGCETVGAGCIDEFSASISLGTTATIQTTSKKYSEPIKFLPSFPSLIPNYYNPEVEIFRGYWMISWFKKEFSSHEVKMAEKLGRNAEELLDENLDLIPPGSQGLILQPYWGPHIKTPLAKGSIIGFGDVHTRAHIYRAIVEGINYSLIEGLELIEKAGKKKITRLFISGGGSQSDSICQITSDMFNLQVQKPKTVETSTIGSAMAAFIGLGVFSSFSEAVENMVNYKKIFKPNKENTEIYKNLYENVYKKIYPSLKHLYDKIQRITKYPQF